MGDNNTVKIPDNTATSLQWVKIDRFLAEYNPKRYDLYASLFRDNTSNVRNMKLSPMYEFVFRYNKSKSTGEKFIWTNTRYYQMQLLYGRDHPYAMVKMSNFINTFNNIEKNGIKEYPLVTSEGEHGQFQIKDGHHRIACAMVLDYKKIICKVITEAIA